jgi:hypothetical protein
VARKICVLQAQNARLVSDFEQEKGKFVAHAQRFEAQERQISQLLEADRAHSEDIAGLQRECESRCDFVGCEVSRLSRTCEDLGAKLRNICSPKIRGSFRAIGDRP